MILQDKTDELLGVLLHNPDKVSRELLRSLSLSKNLFAFDKASANLFQLIISASYANKKVSEQLVEAFAIKNKLSKEDEEEIKFALFRAQEQEKDFSTLEEKILLFLSERKRYLLSKSIHSLNDRLTKGDPIEDILIQQRDDISSINEGTDKAATSSLRGRSTEFLSNYERDVSADALEYPFKPITDVVGRALPGELHLIAGASGEGKSIILSNILYHNMVYKGKNQLLASLEMSETQCLYRLLSLHSTHPKFSYNLEHEKIKKKELSEVEKEQFSDVVQDFFDNPEYGQLFFTQNATTVAEIFEEATDINRCLKLHGIYIDYIALLETKASNEQAAIAKSFKQIKQNALTFDKGAGIPVISVHQISEQAKEKAEESGRYDYNFLSGTSESRKSSDLVMWMLRTKEHMESHEISMGFAKVRDAEPGHDFSLFEDFAHAKAEAIDTDIT